MGDGNVRSDVNLAVLDLLNQQGIEIPLPQSVVRQVVVPPALAPPPPATT